MKSLEHYRAVVADLETMDELNRDIARHFPHLAVPKKLISTRIEKAKLAYAKREIARTKSNRGANAT